jgi:hypothetical protein
MCDTCRLRAAVRPFASSLTTGAEAEAVESAEVPCVSAPHSAVPARHAGPAVLRGQTVQKGYTSVAGWRNSGHWFVAHNPSFLAADADHCLPGPEWVAENAKPPAHVDRKCAGVEEPGAKLVGQDARSGIRTSERVRWLKV